MGIAIDDSRGAVVVVTFTGAQTDAEFDAYLAWMRKRMDEGRPAAYVMDARGTVITSNAQIRRQGMWVKAHHADISNCCKGTAFVFDSPALRFVLSSIFLIHRPPVPYMVTRDVDEAIGWASTQTSAVQAAVG